MKALIIYDEFDCAVRASTAVQRAGVRANGRASFDIKPWRTDVLKLRLAAEEALNEAIDADLIVFAGVLIEVVPPWLEKWLECWAIRRKVRDAVLLVIQNRATGGLAVNAGPQLSRLAERHGLGLIVGSENGVEDPTPSVAGGPCERANFKMPAAPPASIRGSWRNWGIND